MKTIFLPLLLLAAWQSVSAAPSDTQKLAAADNAFAFKLLRQLAREQPATNIFISPYSAVTVLQIADDGATGQTKSEMQQVLGTAALPFTNLALANQDISRSLNNSNTNIILTTANAIWYRQTAVVKADFLTRNRQFFDATIAPLNFEDPHASGSINQWAADQTHGRINEIAGSQLDPATALFLANAVYFKGKWSDPFKPQDTQNLPFHLRSGALKTVPLMGKAKSFTYRRGTGYQAVRLPYQGENLAMYVFLPDTNSSPEKLLSIMSGETWQRITKPGFNEKEGTLMLPRFKINDDLNLIPPLKALGMKSAFSQTAADFSGIAPELFISGVRQKTFVDVKEEGTEAAAVTGMEAVPSGAEAPPIDPFQIIVDRPFLFLIEDNQTSAILFMGIIFDPTTS